jgi:SecD/SecF fusion protein
LLTRREDEVVPVRPRTNLLILLAVACALLGAGVAALTHRPVLGLDLRGGTEVTLVARPLDPGQHSLDVASVMPQVRSIIERRVNALGVREPSIQIESGGRLLVQLAGVTDPRAVERVIGSTGGLTMVPLTESLEPGVSARVDGSPYPRPTLAALRAAERANGVRVVPGRSMTISCVASSARACPGAPPGAIGTFWYLLRLPSDPQLVLRGNDVRGARADVDPAGGNIVTMSFSDRGNREFKAITERLARDGNADWELHGGSAASYARSFAVILDGRLESTPSVDFQRYPTGIDPSGSGAEISQIPTAGEAHDIAVVLQTGSLPVRLVPLEESQVSATLGQASLQQGLVAAAAGLVAVMVFLVVFYRLLGLVADVALLVYAVLLYGLCVSIPITLTLPGIAGIALTVGVAADANVVVFERIKEELRGGRTPRSAIAAGYARGFRTIVDASIVTLITAGVLFVAGSGAVKGFAFTLAVGTLVSTFCAVFVTRALLAGIVRVRWLGRASLLAGRRQRAWRIDLVGRRGLWLTVSAIAVAVSVGSLATRGLERGIDLRGGTSIHAALARPASVDAVRAVVHGAAPDDGRLAPARVLVQGLGREIGGRYGAVQVTTRTLPPAEARKVRDALDARFGPLERSEVRSVSASFSSQLLADAAWAVAFSLLLIVLYVAARFDWRYAVPAIVAVLHDVLLTAGVYSLTGREVTAATVAAVLTVLGYSLYDTIIVFDRVRENVRARRRGPFARLVNDSLQQTLTRSLSTSAITLVPIASLYLFGGDTLRDFAFALLVGITSGACSSLLVAAPLLAWLGERWPPAARQRVASQSREERPLAVR